MAKKVSSPQFQDQWKLAVENSKKPEEKRNLDKEACFDESGLRITMRRKLWFLAEADFQSVFKMTAKEAGIRMESLAANGTVLTGVFVHDTSSPWREVFVDWCSNTRLQRTLLDQSQLVRPDQASDCMEHWQSEVQKGWAPSLAKAPSYSMADLHRAVEDQLCARQEQELARQRQAEGVVADQAQRSQEQPAPEAQPDIPSDGSEVDEELVAAERRPRPPLPVRGQKPASSKAKPKEPKEKKREQKKRDSKAMLVNTAGEGALVLSESSMKTWPVEGLKQQKGAQVLAS